MTRRHDDEDDPIELLRDAAHGETQVAAEQAAEATVARSNRQWLPFIVGSVVLISILISSATAFAIIDLYARQTQVATTVSEIRQLAEQAKTAGEQANSELARRGQAQVPIPQPGQAQDSEVLVSAATARVLASLPDNRPTTGQIVDAVTVYMAANASRFGPAPQQINESVADYLAKNPAPPGPPGVPGADGKAGKDGKDGVDGHTPTEQEIQDAWIAYIRDHPDALCPKGGSFAQLRVQLADGGTADMWTCVVQVTPSTTTQPSAVPLLPIGR